MGLKMIPEAKKGVIRVPKPRPGDRQVGVTADGQAIYEGEFEMDVLDENGRPVKDQVIGPDGKPAVIYHPTTGAAIKKKLKVRKEMVTRRYVVHVERNERGVATGSHSFNFNFEQDPEELKRIESEYKAKEFGQELFAKAAERGVSADELLDRLTGQAGPATGEEKRPAGATEGKPPASPDPEEAEYPEHVPVGRWILSDEHRAAVDAGEAEPIRAKKDDALEMVANGITMPPAGD